MRPTGGPVSHLTLSAQRRLARLVALASEVASPLNPEGRRTLSYVVIEAANLWSQYSRCYFLSIAIGATDATGRCTVVAPAASLLDAEDLAVHAIHPSQRSATGPWSRRWQPDWQSRKALLDSLRYVRSSLYADVDTALSLPTRVLLDLPTVRNFYAHKGQRAARSVTTIHRHYGITRSMPPHELLCSVPPARSDSLLNEWLADLSAILGLMP